MWSGKKGQKGRVFVCLFLKIIHDGTLQQPLVGLKFYFYPWLGQNAKLVKYHFQ